MYTFLVARLLLLVYVRCFSFLCPWLFYWTICFTRQSMFALTRQVSEEYLQLIQSRVATVQMM